MLQRHPKIHDYLKEIRLLKVISIINNLAIDKRYLVKPCRALLRLQVELYLKNHRNEDLNNNDNIDGLNNNNRSNHTITICVTNIT